MASQPICPICGVYLIEPYIKCAECPLSFCLHCFAKGCEYNQHKKNHDYIVVKTNFPVFDNWTAAEEMALLNAISDCGIDNWAEIASIVSSKTKIECMNHYNDKYNSNDAEHVLPINLIEKKKSAIKKILRCGGPLPIRCSTKCKDPPRPMISSGYICNEMAGYMPARGDFATEPNDDYLELSVNDLGTYIENKTDVPMCVNALNIFNDRLKKRKRSMAIAKTYALINTDKNIDEMSRYDQFKPKVLSYMKSLMRLMKPAAYDALMEAILCETNLKKRIKILKECRSAGITKREAISIFLRLKEKQERNLTFFPKTHTMLDEILAEQMKDENSIYRNDFIRKQVTEMKDGVGDGVSISGRRPAPPLQITGLPSFEELSDREKNLCSILRIYPTAFLQYKSMLINEYRKLGSLRLANARLIMKIDVNKTRKIYDLLLEDGVISKGPPVFSMSNAL